MSANISPWLLEDIDLTSLENPTTAVEPLATDDTYIVYTVYSNYSDYYNVYSDYYNYYNYYNYSNSISVTRHPISQSAIVNSTVTFSVGASNTIDSCQWYIADASTGSGTAITGATSPTYSFVASRALDNKYYYCIVRRGGNSSTSNRALLTILSLDAFDIYVNVNRDTNLFFIRANPPTTEIASISVSDESVATVTEDRLIRGISLGTTECSVTGTNGATVTFNITVLPDTPGDHLSVILSNTAIAIREYAGVSHSIYPNQMANIFRGESSTSTPYGNLEDLFLDIADQIREREGTTEIISPYDFYYRILSLTV